jgi:hypothetical protein
VVAAHRAGQSEPLTKHHFCLCGPHPPQTLDRILDRGHLAANRERPYPESGVGYEVVAQIDGSGLLKGVE